MVGRRPKAPAAFTSETEAESTSGHMVLPGVLRKKSPVTPPGIEPGTVRLVVQRLNHYTTPGPNVCIYIIYIYICIYRVIHKSVKHFKNSQQIDYAPDNGNSSVDRERNC